MHRSAILRLCLVAACGALAGGCAMTTCASTPQKLSLLRRGMTYEETAQVMGCTGMPVSTTSVASGEFATVEWDGPSPRVFTGTQVDFLDGRLLSFTTARRGGL